MEVFKEFFSIYVEAKSKRGYSMLQVSNMKGYLQLLGGVCEEERNILYVIKKTT